MSLQKELESVVKTYTTEIGLIGNFVRDVDRSLTRKQKRKPKSEFTQEHAKELRSVVEALDGVLSGKVGEVNLNISNEVSKFILQKIIPLKHEKFLSEMALSYLISHQEAFLKDYIFEILVHRKYLLRSGTTITFEEVNNHSSMKALISFLSQKEVDVIGHGSIDDAAEYIKKKFNIDMTEHAKWDELREANYRRNIIIHNRAKTNDIYCRKTGYKHRNKHLTTSNKYVLDSVETVKSVIEFLHEKIELKLKLKKGPNKKLNTDAAKNAVPVRQVNLSTRLHLSRRPLGAIRRQEV